MNTEKKERRKLTVADRVHELDVRIGEAESRLEQLQTKRRALLSAATAKAEAELAAVRAAGGTAL